MRTAAVKDRKPVTVAENALARKALEAVQLIEREAQEKKMAQLESLQAAKAAINDRLNELNSQLEQIEEAMTAITGEEAPPREKRSRRKLDETRERVIRWLQGHANERLSAGDLSREFPELQGATISVFLKPLLKSGQLQRDTTEGIRRAKYFVPA